MLCLHKVSGCTINWLMIQFFSAGITSSRSGFPYWRSAQPSLGCTKRTLSCVTAWWWILSSESYRHCRTSALSWKGRSSKGWMCSVWLCRPALPLSSPRQMDVLNLGEDGSVKMQILLVVPHCVFQKTACWNVRVGVVGRFFACVVSLLVCPKAANKLRCSIVVFKPEV